MTAMKPTCPARVSAPSLTPVRREIPLPEQIARGMPDEFSLPQGALWATSPRADLRIQCLRGELWITQAGSADDIVLLTGESFVPAPRGRVVIQALSEARVALVA